MSTQETSVANISTLRDGRRRRHHTQYHVRCFGRSRWLPVSGYTTLQVGTNGAHVIDIPNTFLTTSGAPPTVSVTSTLSVSLTGANLVGSSTALAATTGVGKDTLIGGPGADT